MSFRGPMPLSSNVHHLDNAAGTTPGVGVVQVDENGRQGRLVHVARRGALAIGSEQRSVGGITSPDDFGRARPDLAGSGCVRCFGMERGTRSGSYVALRAGPSL